MITELNNNEIDWVSGGEDDGPGFGEALAIVGLFGGGVAIGLTIGFALVYPPEDGKFLVVTGADGEELGRLLLKPPVV